MAEIIGKMNDKVVALVSGGMDSVVLLNHLLKQGREVLVFNFSYGSKHNKVERRCLRKVCDLLNVPLYSYDLPTHCELQSGFISSPNHPHQDILGTELVPLLKSNLLQTGGDIPEGHYEEPNMKATVVPFRNGIMLAIAIGFAESQEADCVAYACHAGDHVIYPDCRLDFTEVMGTASEIGTYRNVYLDTPFVNMTKGQIAALGLEEGAPLEHTWTCYNGGAENGRPCLKCSTCVERTEAFVKAGAQDPALSDEEWRTATKCMQDAIESWDDRKDD